MAKPIYVFLDTNNWIYLANGFNPYSNKHDDTHLKIFKLLRQRAEQGTIIMLSNQLIIEEFERNKSQARAKVQDIEKKRDSYISSLKPIREFISKEKNLEELEFKITQVAEQKIFSIRNHIFEVERFLNRWTISIPITDQHRIEATHMALDKKAPFTGDKKNSMADALHLLSFSDFVGQKSEAAPTWSKKGLAGYFVSSNSGDFSDPKNREIVHPDLAPVLKGANSKFIYALHKLTNSLEQEFLSKEEEEVIESAQRWDYCFICEHEFQKEDVHHHSLLDPHRIKGVSRDENQLSIFKEFIISPENPLIDIRAIHCGNCNSFFIECGNCNCLNHIADGEEIIECGECGYLYSSKTERNQNGKKSHLGFEIIMTHECTGCMLDFQQLNEEGYCLECWQYELLAKELNKIQQIDPISS